MRVSVPVLLAATFALSACGKETPTATVAQPDAAQQFLEGVPADTPYLSASVTPAPLAKILPWAQTLDDAAMPSTERVEELLADPELRPRKRRALALLSELTGHYTPEGLRELGFSATPRIAIFGIGVLPAAKFEIEDSAKVEAFIERFLERAQIDAERTTLDDAKLWSFQTGKRKRTTFVVLEPDVMRMGVATDSTKDIVRAELLSPTLSNSLTDESVIELGEKWGMKSYSVGFLDLEAIASTILGDGTGIGADVWAKVRPQKFEVSDACRAETRVVAEVLPRVVFGSEGWSNSALGFGAGVELRSQLPSKLMQTRVSSPALISTDAVGTMGLGFSLGEAANVVRTAAEQIAAQPLECKWYRGINRGAKMLSSRWAILPPALQEVDGATVIVKDVSATDDAPKVVDAIALIGTTEPQSLIDLVAGFDTDLAMNAPDVGAITTIPESPLTRRMVDAKLVRFEKAAAVTTGAWSDEELASLEVTTKDVPFFHIAYDAEAIASRLGFEGEVAPVRAALRGKTSLAVDPVKEGFRIRTTYSRETGE